VDVVAWSSEPVRPSGSVIVVDLASRHLSEADAAKRVHVLDRWPARRHAHKMDSTLRGNWAVEVAARAARHRVMVVAAFPAIGRVCRNGMVLDGGRPVSDSDAGRDPLTPIRSSRPAELLRLAGVSDVTELHDAAAVSAWLCSIGSVAVCDATSADDLAVLATLWRDHGEVIWAGTAGSIAAAARAAEPSAGPPVPERPVLVVNGSLHRIAAQQVQALEATGCPRFDVDDDADRTTAALDGVGRAVVTVPLLGPTSISVAAATAMASSIARHVAEVCSRIQVSTVVIIGGDTVGAIIGQDRVTVGGTLAPGVAWGRRADGTGPLVITKPGGFGTPETLVELLAARMEP
jgi:uncharacterized protein YgbK (DUF1537 family)